MFSHVSRPCRFLSAACLALACACAAHAQDTPSPKPALTVKVATSRKHGEVEYRFFHDMQQQVQAWLPPEPRLIDFWLQAAYAEMAEATRDAYQPQGWAISILSDSVDQVVPVRRGGYFQLPEVAAAYAEDGIILFREPSRQHQLLAQWALRVGPEHHLAYASLTQALRQLQGVQDRVPSDERALSRFKRADYDAIKACFTDAGGQVSIDGALRADAMVGRCKLIKIEPARIKASADVAFSDNLDIVTFVHLGDYR